MGVTTDMHLQKSGWPSYVITERDSQNDPFELIDMRAEKEDREYEKKVEEEIKTLISKVVNLYEDLYVHNDSVLLRIETGSPPYYGSMTCGVVVQVLTALTLPNSKIEFRTKREALQSLMDLISIFIEKLPEEQRPDGWDKISNWYTSGVRFFDNETSFEYRITALALSIMGYKDFYKARDSNDEEFDEYGKICIPTDEKERLLLGTNNRCICCDRKKEQTRTYIQLNKYAFLCNECAEKAVKIMRNGDIAEITHPFSGERAKNRSAVKAIEEFLGQNNEDE